MDPSTPLTICLVERSSSVFLSCLCVQTVPLPCLQNSLGQHRAVDPTSVQGAKAHRRARLCPVEGQSPVPEATETEPTFSSLGGRPRFRGLCSWALFRGDLEPRSEEPEGTLFFPSPMFFFTFPSDRLSLRFSSPEIGLLLSSLELRRFLSSAELWDDVCKFNNNSDNHHNGCYLRDPYLYGPRPVVSTLCTCVIHLTILRSRRCCHLCLHLGK